MPEDSETPKKLLKPTTPDTHRGTQKQHADALEDELSRIGCALLFLVVMILGFLSGNLVKP
jgi:hypothetical protein